MILCRFILFGADGFLLAGIMINIIFILNLNPIQECVCNEKVDIELQSLSVCLFVNFE